MCKSRECERASGVRGTHKHMSFLLFSYSPHSKHIPQGPRPGPSPLTPGSVAWDSDPESRVLSGAHSHCPCCLPLVQPSSLIHSTSPRCLSVTPAPSSQQLVGHSSHITESLLPPEGTGQTNSHPRL